jgi:hypothetical protein
VEDAVCADSPMDPTRAADSIVLKREQPVNPWTLVIPHILLHPQIWRFVVASERQIWGSEPRLVRPNRLMGNHQVDGQKLADPGEWCIMVTYG